MIFVNVICAVLSIPFIVSSAYEENYKEACFWTVIALLNSTMVVLDLLGVK